MNRQRGPFEVRIRKEYNTTPFTKKPGAKKPGAKKPIAGQKAAIQKVSGQESTAANGNEPAPHEVEFETTINVLEKLSYISNNKFGFLPELALGTSKRLFVLSSPLEPPTRRFECPNYKTCLNLAAALDWESFSCAGCNGKINEQLLWRAHQELRRDKVAEQLCELPRLSRKAGKQKKPPDVSPPDSSSPDWEELPAQRKKL